MDFYFAQFTGVNGSMGFKTNEIYPITVYEERKGLLGRKYIMVRWFDEKRRKWVICPYGNVNLFLENWKVRRKRVPF